MTGLSLKYFQPHEILSPDGLKQFDAGNLMLQGFAVAGLDKIREMINEPILVNHAGLTLRGYRSVQENITIPDSGRHSRHIQGIAFDCTTKSRNYLELIIKALIVGARGVGFYPQRNFVHIDFRTSDHITGWLDNGNKLKNFKMSVEDLDRNMADVFISELRSNFQL